LRREGYQKSALAARSEGNQEPRPARGQPSSPRSQFHLSGYAQLPSDEPLELLADLVAHAVTALQFGGEGGCSGAEEGVKDRLAPEAVHANQATGHFDGEGRNPRARGSALQEERASGLSDESCEAALWLPLKRIACTQPYELPVCPGLPDEFVNDPREPLPLTERRPLRATS